MEAQLDSELPGPHLFESNLAVNWFLSYFDPQNLPSQQQQKGNFIHEENKCHNFTIHTCNLLVTSLRGAHTLL